MYSAKNTTPISFWSVAAAVLLVLFPATTLALSCMGDGKATTYTITDHSAQIYHYYFSPRFCPPFDNPWRCLTNPGLPCFPDLTDKNYTLQVHLDPFSFDASVDSSSQIVNVPSCQTGGKSQRDVYECIEDLSSYPFEPQACSQSAHVYAANASGFSLAGEKSIDARAMMAIRTSGGKISLMSQNRNCPAAVRWTVDNTPYFGAVLEGGAGVSLSNIAVVIPDPTISGNLPLPQIALWVWNATSINIQGLYKYEISAQGSGNGGETVLNGPLQLDNSDFVYFGSPWLASTKSSEMVLSGTTKTSVLLTNMDMSSIDMSQTGWSGTRLIQMGKGNAPYSLSSSVDYYNFEFAAGCGGPFPCHSSRMDCDHLGSRKSMTAGLIGAGIVLGILFLFCVYFVTSALHQHYPDENIKVD